MQKSKLGLDFEKVEYARSLAKGIAEDVQAFVEQYTTVAVERTLCRLMGIDGIDENEVPLPNVVVEALKDKGVLNEGALFFIANAMIQTGLKPQQIAEKVAAGELDITRVVTTDQKQIADVLQPVIDESMERIRARRARREAVEHAHPLVLGVPAASTISKPLARVPNPTSTSLWQPVTFMKMWCRPRQVPAKVPM